MSDPATDITTEPVGVNSQTDLAHVEDLEAVVDQLVAEIDQTVHEIEMSRGESDATPVREGDVVGAEAVLTDEGATDVVAPEPEPEIDTSVEEPASDEPVGDGSIEAQVDQMIDEATRTDEIVGEDTDAIEGEPGEPSERDLGVCEESIEALDQRLANDAQQELEGDFETVDGEFESFDFSPETSDAAEPAAPAEASTEPPVVEEDAPTSETPDAPEEPGAHETHEEVTDEQSDVSERPAVRLSEMLSHPVIERAGGALRRASTPVADVLSMPLRRVEPRIRDTVGWVAINTLFIALCVWLFLLLR
ncbi:MAG: hypothetical protein ACF8GE_00330 [Phycisphaerales bacterium JB043]